MMGSLGEVVLRRVLVIGALLGGVACGGDAPTGGSDGGGGTPPSASRLTVLAQPASTVAGVTIAPAIAVAMQDVNGSTVSGATGSVTATITPQTGTVGATLAGTLTASAVAGVARFEDLAIEKAGTGYTLTFSASGLTAATSTKFDVVAAAAATVQVVSEPGTVPAGARIAPAVRVAVADAFGNPVRAASTRVSIAIAPGTGAPAAKLTGTLEAATVDGVATFDDLAIDLPAAGYRLTATATGLTAAVSDAFTVEGGTITGTVTTVATLTSVGGATVRAPLAAELPAATLVPDELVVTFQPIAGITEPPVRGMSVASLGRLDSALRARAGELAAGYGEVLGTSPAIRAARLRVSDAGNVEQIRQTWARRAGVQRVERNALIFSAEGVERVPTTAPGTMQPAALRPRLATLTPVLASDPDAPRQAWNYLALDADYAWSVTTGSVGVLVAVVDDGTRYDHPDLAPNLTTDGYDFASSMVVASCAGGTVDLAGDGGGPDPDPTIPKAYLYDSRSQCYTPSTGLGGHALHVTGIIGAAANNGIGGSGIAWQVRIRPVRVMNGAGIGTTWDVAQGVLYAAGLPASNGTSTPVQAPSAARVINLSLTTTVPTLDLQDAVNAAVANDVLIVAAAGNSANTTPNYPAAWPVVVSVSSVGPDLALASYSSYGSTIDLAAPGGDVADGDLTFGVYSARWNFGSNTPAYEYLQGTSMAAPHVTGVAALVLAGNPLLSAAEVRSRLETYATDLGPAGRDEQYGAGLVNARGAVTATKVPARTTRARLYDAATGAIFAEIPVSSTGAYSFALLPNGSYWVYAGEDEDADGVLGVPGRRWGAYGGSAAPTPLVVSGGVALAASFTVGYPAEAEPNDLTSANVLVVGGYLRGTTMQTDADAATVRIPVAGTYVFETRPVRGACGFALEANTTLELNSPAGTVLARSDDVNAAALDYCSRVSVSLAAGVYTVRVLGATSTSRRYYVVARAATTSATR